LHTQKHKQFTFQDRCKKEIFLDISVAEKETVKVLRKIFEAEIVLSVYITASTVALHCGKVVQRLI